MLWVPSQGCFGMELIVTVGCGGTKPSHLHHFSALGGFLRSHKSALTATYPADVLNLGGTRRYVYVYIYIYLIEKN